MRPVHLSSDMPVNRSFPHVVVIGAGIVGAATAFHLRRAGAKVTVVDARTPSAGATGASDGAVSVASKRPGVMMQLARQARDLYAQLVREDVLTDLFHTRPTYLFARSELEVAVIAAQQRDLDSQDEPTLWLDRAALMGRVPGLGGSVLAGLKVPKDGHALGYQVTHRLLSYANVVPLRHTPVHELVLSGNRVVGVETCAGRIMADVVVLAAGIESMAFVGLDQVMIPRKGQLIVTDRAAFGYAVLPGPLMSASYLASKHTSSAQQSSVSLVIDPLRTGQFLLGSSRETGITDRQTDIRTVATILREAIDVYPPLARQRVIRTFAGIRATTEDGLPIVGRHPTLDGLIVATAMQGDGICLGPLVGAAVARWALGQDSAQDLSALSPARFLAAQAVVS
ncbi:MAG: FAD-dependent oxidoreductase [Betaproteobacteria bacterium HGW-Betaproteobacteria-18]|nr:MAG: FAD-dependent oxidoreductase [Betaproteobacteria bacterium HGW-Betaproteobacteria-18]